VVGDPRDYMIQVRYLTSGEGWRLEEIKLPATSYEVAGREASKKAKWMDDSFGDSHFWTVELHDDPKAPTGAYFQLFHGRTS